jgi:hypothetical protein
MYRHSQSLPLIHDASPLDAANARASAFAPTDPQQRTAGVLHPHCDDFGGPKSLASGERRKEGQTTASGALFQPWRRTPLTGPKERFCSDSCRIRSVRADQRDRRIHLLDTIPVVVLELRENLGGGDGSH